MVGWEPAGAGVSGQVGETPQACEQRDLEQLREVGYSDEDILHIVEVTAIFNYNVRLATATGLFPNVEYHHLGRTPAV